MPDGALACQGRRVWGCGKEMNIHYRQGAARKTNRHLHLLQMNYKEECSSPISLASGLILIKVYHRERKYLSSHCTLPISYPHPAETALSGSDTLISQVNLKLQPFLLNPLSRAQQPSPSGTNVLCREQISHKMFIQLQSSIQYLCVGNLPLYQLRAFAKARKLWEQHPPPPAPHSPA